MNPKCSIIIPTYNTAALTLRCLEQIRKNPPSVTYEILVVDNHSTDGTPDKIRAADPAVRVVVNDSNLGFSKACNAGAREAKGLYFLFLNSDTEPLPKSFDYLTRWMDAHPKTGIVGPELINSQGQFSQMSWGWHPLMAGEFIQQFFAPYIVRRSWFRRTLIQYLQRKSRHVPSICGACLMIRRETFEQISGFDEDFELYFEDSDLCWRCIKAGWHIDFDVETKIVHHLGQSTQGSWSLTSLIYQQSHIAFYRKHAPTWGVSLLKLYLTLKWLRLCLAARRDPGDAKQGPRYCRAYWTMIREHRKITLSEGLPS